MKKALLFIFILTTLILVPIPGHKAHKNEAELNNKTLSSEKAIREESVVVISYFDKASGLTLNSQEVYNIHRLDAFMEKVKRGQKDEVRIVNYGKNGKDIWVNKLYDIKFDGKNTINNGYDVYSNSDEFIPLKPFVFSKIIKWDYNDSYWYGMSYPKGEKTDCTTLMSFKKISIVKKK